MKTKLPGLNGLRAIAATLVLVSHVFQISGIYGDEASASLFQKYHHLGTDMVNLFFVISGFIITYILCKEKNKTGTISLWNFYLKRFLRIWPLYFGIIILVLGLTFFTDIYALFPAINNMGLVILCFFIVTFYSFLNNPSISVLRHYWSLSVEEQFYLIWPILFKHLKGKWLYMFPWIVIFGVMILRNAASYFYGTNPRPTLFSLLRLLDQSMFGSIAIGILGAFIIERKHPILKLFFKPVVQVIAWLVILVSLIIPFTILYVHYEMMGLVYLILILNVTANSKTLISLDNKIMDRVGTISYGIYMFHWILIPILIVGIQKIGWWDFFKNTYQVPLLLISFIVTYLIAALSYKYFESYFLRLKPAEDAAKDKPKIQS